jgi:hypothetical protein
MRRRDALSGPPPTGWVQIVSTDPDVTVLARLSGDRPNVTGFGGWAQIARPRRPPMTTFQASPGLVLTLPILFDGFRDEESVEPKIADLVKLGSPSASDAQPPIVTVDARGGAVPYQGRQWVVSDLAFGDAVMDKNGNRTRQQVTVTLMEYVPVVYLTQKSAAARQRHKHNAAKSNPGARNKRIKAKRARKGVAHSLSLLTAGAVPTAGDGEDLLTIAARELGDADRWTEIAELNGIRDPRSITTGQVIRLP